MSASHQNLAAAVRAGRFRADLYYRLNGLTLTIPPLRERTEDVEPLADATVKRLSARFLSRLTRHTWPGNVRELQHTIGQALLLEDGRTVEGHHFERMLQEPPPPAPVASALSPTTPPDRRTRAEAAVYAARGNKSKAAKDLGVTRKTLYDWLHR